MCPRHTNKMSDSENDTDLNGPESPNTQRRREVWRPTVASTIKQKPQSVSPFLKRRTFSPTHAGSPPKIFTSTSSPIPASCKTSPQAVVPVSSKSAQTGSLHDELNRAVSTQVTDRGSLEYMHLSTPMGITTGTGNLDHKNVESFLRSLKNGEHTRPLNPPLPATNIPSSSCTPENMNPAPTELNTLGKTESVMDVLNMYDGENFVHHCTAQDHRIPTVDTGDRYRNNPQMIADIQPPFDVRRGSACEDPTGIAAAQQKRERRLVATVCALKNQVDNLRDTNTVLQSQVYQLQNQLERTKRPPDSKNPGLINEKRLLLTAAWNDLVSVLDSVGDATSSSGNFHDGASPLHQHQGRSIGNHQSSNSSIASKTSTTHSYYTNADSIPSTSPVALNPAQRARQMDFDSKTRASPRSPAKNRESLLPDVSIETYRSAGASQ